jgi:hypothetical protein
VVKVEELARLAGALLNSCYYLAWPSRLSTTQCSPALTLLARPRHYFLPRNRVISDHRLTLHTSRRLRRATTFNPSIDSESVVDR